MPRTPNPPDSDVPTEPPRIPDLPRIDRPSRAEAEAAVRTLLRWACDDPTREGLLDTPARVVRSYEEFFSGYRTDPVALLRTDLERSTAYSAYAERLAKAEAYLGAEAVQKTAVAA